MARIALDASYILASNPTGTSTYSRRLIESLAALDTPHDFLLCYRLSRFFRRREVRRPGGGRLSSRLMEDPWTFWLPREAGLFHSLAQRPPAFRFKREVVTVHDVFPITGRDYSAPDFQRKFSGLLRRAVSRADRIISVSEYTASEMARHCAVDRDKIRVIPLGVDQPRDVLSPEQRRLERERLVGEGNEMLLAVGVIETRKNLGNALRALQHLPERYRLVLAGGDGYGSEAIHAPARLEPRVKMLGYVSRARLGILYQAAGALLFPSLEEGFGLPVLEAMSHGLPVVASRTSSLPEVGGTAALYVDPHDPLDIAEKVTEAVESAGCRERLVRMGLERARQFTWRRTAEETLKVYEELLR